MESSRLIAAILVTMAVLFAYQQFLQWRYPSLYGPKAKPSPAASPSVSGTLPPGASASPGGLEGAAPAAGNPAMSAPNDNQAGGTNGASSPGKAAMTAAPGRTIAITTDYYTASIDTHGARLISFRLKKYRQTDSPNSLDYELIRPGPRMPIGLIVLHQSITLDDSGVDYTTDAPTRIEVSTTTTVNLVGTTRDGIKLRKSFRFSRSSYVFDLDAEAASSGGAAANTIGLTMSQPLTELAGYRDYPEIQADVQGKAMTWQEKAVQKGVAPLSGQIEYAGFGDRYFLTAFVPKQPATLSISYDQGEADAQLFFSTPGRAATSVYMGPKALDVLESVDPVLSKAIDLGFWGIIALPFLRLLKIFYRIIPNYGIAIMLLTAVVRLLTLPMSIKGQRSMMRMQRLQPQVERIREKYKDDSERLNREMVELYKRNHVNPLGGCLPMVVQFPVFIGLYEALLNAVELRHAAFVGWIRDLSAPDCLHIAGVPEIPFTSCHGIPALVALMTASTFLQQWLMPRQPDPNQQKMMMLMPLVFSVIFLSLPSGLALYYLASNLLGIAQQLILNKEFKQPEPEAVT